MKTLLDAVAALVWLACTFAFCVAFIGAVGFIIWGLATETWRLGITHIVLSTIAVGSLIGWSFNRVSRNYKRDLERQRRRDRARAKW